MPPPVKTIRQRTLVPASPKQVYDALVTARLHAAFTGAAATGAARVGGRFTAWDGYISGIHRELVAGKRIVWEWTTTEWPDGAGPSRVELTLKPAKGGTALQMVHSNVPAVQTESYRQGWIEHYWTPLKKYFQAKTKA